MKARLPLLFALVALSHAASAVVVNIDFDFSATSTTFSGRAAAPDAAGNNYWNSIVSTPGSGIAAGTNLRDSANSGSASDTTISISITGIDVAISSNGDQELTSGHSDLMREYIRVDSGSSTVVKTSNGTIGGLVPSASYEIYFYGQGQYLTGGTANNQRGQNTLFDIGGDKKQTKYDSPLAPDDLLTEGVEYVRYLVSANASGVINFSWSNVVPGVNVTTDDAPNPAGGGSRFGALNGIQIRSVPVPEPAAAFLGGLGLLGILIRRRR